LRVTVGFTWCKYWELCNTQALIRTYNDCYYSITVSIIVNCSNHYLVWKCSAFYGTKQFMNKSSFLVLILSQMNLFHILISYFFKIHFSTFLPSVSVFFKWCLLFMFSNLSLVCSSHLFNILFILSVVLSP
jgi:hypothetical protein